MPTTKATVRIVSPSAVCSIARFAHALKRTTNGEASYGIEPDALCQRQRVGVIDGCGLAAHVGLPRVRAGLAAAAGFLFAPERAADFRARRADVHIGDAAIRTCGCHEAFRLLHILREDAGRKPLRHGVV